MNESSPVAVPINFSLEHPPVHPKCRMFDHLKILKLGEKLLAEGNIAAVDQLGAAMQRLLSQPKQGAWHEFKPGRVGPTRIIATQDLRGLNAFQLTKVGFCDCPHCRKTRRVN